MRIHEKVKILRLLRDGSIAAEMMPAAAPSMTEQFAYANARMIPYLVVFDVDDLQMNSTVKIKQVHGKVEEECSLDDLVMTLNKHVLPARHRHGFGYPGDRFGPQMSRSLSTEDLSDAVTNGNAPGGSPFNLSTLNRRRRF